MQEELARVLGELPSPAPKQTESPVSCGTYIDMQPEVVLLTKICNLLYWVKSSINSRACGRVDIKRNIPLQVNRSGSVSLCHVSPLHISTGNRRTAAALISNSAQPNCCGSDTVLVFSVVPFTHTFI